MNIKQLKINDVQRTLHFEKLLCYFIIKLINYYLLLFDIVLLFIFSSFRLSIYVMQIYIMHYKYNALE